MLTLLEQYLASEQRAKQAFAISPNNSLLSTFVKLVFGLPLWRIFYWTFMDLVMRAIGHWSYTNEEAAEARFRRVIDSYVLLAGSLLFCFYIIAYDRSFGSWIVCVVGGACCIIRLFEIFSIFVQMHLTKGYRTSDAPRAVLNTFWHYAEIAVIFATFYLLLARAEIDNFHVQKNDNSFLDSWINPIYFSFVTMMTIGYGDFSPRSPAGRSLVCLETFLGVVMLVVVFQRAITASMAVTRVTTVR